MKKLLIIITLISVAMACKKEEQDDLSVKVTIPSAFIPNNPDGTTNGGATCINGQPNCNKRFTVIISDPNNIGYQVMTYIYDSKGNNLYQSLDPSEGWDGTLGNNGNDYCPQGSYHYLIKVTEPATHKSKIFEGSVALLR